MAPKPYKPTDKHIETVRALKEKGATDKACFEAIGISKNTWLKNKGLFEPSIKEAGEIRAEREITAAERRLKLAEQTLDKEIQGYWIEEETTVTKVIGGEEYTETKVQRKWMRPNTPMNIMTLVNCSNEKSEINWQSVNKVENTFIANETEDKPVVQFTKPKNDNA